MSSFNIDFFFLVLLSFQPPFGSFHLHVFFLNSQPLRRRITKKRSVKILKLGDALSKGEDRSFELREVPWPDRGPGRGPDRGLSASSFASFPPGCRHQRVEPGNQVAISKVEILILHLEKAGSSPARDKRGMLASRKRKGKEEGHDRLVAE
jgi:hypothetical protein